MHLEFEAGGVEVIFDDRLSECEEIYFEAGDHIGLVHVSTVAFRSLMGKARHGMISQHI